MKGLVYILVIPLLFSSCKKKSFGIINLNGNRIDVMGHAGMGFSNVYPINSLESILNCLAIGANGTEMDIQLTKDSVLVAFHDEDLSHSTNLNGVINSMTWSEVKDAIYNTSLFSVYQIVSLDEIFSSIENYNDYKFVFDVKPYTENTNTNKFYENFTNAIIALIEKYDLDDNVFIESQIKGFLALLQSKKSHYELYHNPQTFQEGLAVVKELGIKGISISTEGITTMDVEQAHSNGIFVTIWSVKSKEENNEAVQKNPDMILSDRLKYLVDLLN